MYDFFKHNIYDFQDRVLENIDVVFTWSLAVIAFTILYTRC